jgi:hypothetical protein
VRTVLAFTLFAGCGGGSDARVILRVWTPATDPFAEATQVRVTFESDPPLVEGPVPLTDGSFSISVHLPADAPAARFVVEALDADETVVGHGATPPVQPLQISGDSFPVLVAVPLVPEGGPAPPPEPLGAPAAASLGSEWLGVTTDSGALIVYDLLLHEWIEDVAEPPAPIHEATAVRLENLAMAFAGGPEGGIQLYEGSENAWRAVELPAEAQGPWLRPASIACEDGSTLLVGGGDGAGGAREWVVRLASDGVATMEAPLATARAGHTASGELVVGGAPGDPSVEVVGCDGTRTVVPDVAGSDRTGHAATRLADGSVLVAGGELGGAATAEAMRLPADCAPGACDPIHAGALLPAPRTNFTLATLPEGGAVALGAGDAIAIDPDAWMAAALAGDAIDASAAVLPVATGDLAALGGEGLAFLAPRVLYAAPPH